jgi:hypothetical protein
MTQGAPDVATEGPESSTVRSIGRLPASRRLWGLDWTRELPRVAGDFTIEAGTFDEAYPFMREHYPTIFDGDAAARFFAEEMTEAKLRYLRDADAFIFRAEGRVAGICLAHPSDWSTYYVRTMAFLPELRRRGAATALDAVFGDVLPKVGVDRYEAETSIANRPMMEGLLGWGAVVTGTVTSERWGAMVRLTRFLDRAPEDVFRRQFVFGGKPEINPRFADSATHPRRRPR